MDRDKAQKIAGVAGAVVVALVAIWLGSDGFGTGSGSDETRISSGQPSGTDTTATTPPPDAEAAQPPTDETKERAVDPVSGLPLVALATLPPEVADTLDDIDAGPPYPYDRDGVTFENREGLLPDEEYGYYQEFTVETPGSSDRGARRVIWGLGDEFYYTGDHYDSFSRIAP